MSEQNYFKMHVQFRQLNKCTLNLDNHDKQQCIFMKNLSSKSLPFYSRHLSIVAWKYRYTSRIIVCLMVSKCVDLFCHWFTCRTFHRKQTSFVTRVAHLVVNFKAIHLLKIRNTFERYGEIWRFSNNTPLKYLLTDYGSPLLVLFLRIFRSVIMTIIYIS